MEGRTWRGTEQIAAGSGAANSTPCTHRSFSLLTIVWCCQAARDLMESGNKKGSTWRWRWVFGGGKPPHLEDAAEGTSNHVMLTGHSDGRVRVWDLATEVPGLLATVPFDSGGAGTRLRAVTAVQVSRCLIHAKNLLLTSLKSVSCSAPCM